MYLPEAERERAALPEVDVAAMIDADTKLRALVLGWVSPTQAPSAVPQDSGNSGHAAVAARGGCCTGR